jgi:hypothetical protein
MNELNRNNILWESSRMFLPEHKQAILEQRKEATRFVPPELDEQKLEEIGYLIQEAIEQEQPVLVTYAGDYQVEEFCGFVDKVDIRDKYIHLSNGQHKKRISFDKLMSVDWA